MAQCCRRVIARLLRHHVSAGVADDGDALGPDYCVASTSAIMGNRGQVNYAGKCRAYRCNPSVVGEVASRGITVKAIAPGVVESPAVAAVMDARRIAEMVSVKHAGRPAEVADLVATFIASEQAAYISGQAISINGMA